MFLRLFHNPASGLPVFSVNLLSIVVDSTFRPTRMVILYQGGVAFYKTTRQFTRHVNG